MLHNLNSVPIDPIFQLLYDYQADERPEKISLGIGLYMDREGSPFVFPSVKKAAQELDVDNFNYQPIGGNRDFLEAVAGLCFPKADSAGIAKQATCGGTHACRMYADLVLRDDAKRQLLVGTPTWGNHFAVFAGLETIRFDHLNEQGLFNLSSYKKVIQESDPGSILLLHGGGTHNPSGMNASLEDLDELIPLIQEREIIMYVDWAYAGFGLGFDQDRAWMAKLWDALSDISVGVSFSKNASLYEHRCGALFIKTDQVQTLESNMQQISREAISMAPGFGQEVMLNVLTNTQEQWLTELEEARVDIDQRKNALLDLLPESFQHLRSTQGMFGLLPLDSVQIQRLRDEFALYIPGNGRVNWGGIAMSQVALVGERIGRVIEA
jgi:aspartate/tyrosine/aromatic aminotransferase